MNALSETINRVKSQFTERESTEPRPGSLPGATSGQSHQQKRLSVDQIMRRCLPAEYADADDQGIPQLSRVNPYGNGWGVCFRGNPGIGKTYAAAALARMLLLRNEAVGNEAPERYLQFEMSSYLFIRIADTFTASATETRKRIIDDLSRARILILDDLGSEKNTEHTVSTLRTLFARRRNERRITIVTTNLSLGELDAWEPSIASRLGEMIDVSLPDRDRRLER